MRKLLTLIEDYITRTNRLASGSCALYFDIHTNIVYFKSYRVILELAVDKATIAMQYVQDHREYEL